MRGSKEIDGDIWRALALAGPFGKVTSCSHIKLRQCHRNQNIIRLNSYIRLVFEIRDLEVYSRFLC